MTIFFNHFRDHQNVNFFDSFYKVAIFTGKPILCQLSPPSILLALWCKTEKNHNAWNQWCIYISQKPLYRTNAISISIFPRSTCNLLKCINPLLKLGKKELKILQNPNLTRLWRSFVAQFLLIFTIEKNFLTYRNLLGKGHTRPF